MLMGIGYHMYIRYAERTARELKALVKKEATINGELVLINTEEKLKSIGMHDYRPDDLTTIDRVIKPLFTSGTGDLLQLSDWLEKMDLSLAADVTDVPRLMLANLQAFGLPVLSRFPFHQKRKQLGPYIHNGTRRSRLLTAYKKR